MSQALEQNTAQFGHNSKSVVRGENIGLSALWTFLNPTWMKECNVILMDYWYFFLSQSDHAETVCVFYVNLCVFLWSRSVAAAVHLDCAYDVRGRAVMHINTLATLVDTFSSPAVRKKMKGIAPLY